MQSALNVGTEGTANLLDASTLRGMTLTKEALFERQKNNIVESLMSSMVRIATETGGNSYAAMIQSQFDPGLLASIVETFQKLGYSATTETVTDPKGNAAIKLTLTW